MQTFRRWVALLFSLLLVLGMFTGCGKKGTLDLTESEDDETKSKTSYETPLELKMDVKNARNYQEFQAAIFEYYGGQYGSKIGNAYKYLKGTDFDNPFRPYSYNNYSFQQMLAENNYDYGEDYEFYYKIENKEKLDQETLKEFQEAVRDAADDLYSDYQNADSDDILYDWDVVLSDQEAETFAQIYRDVAKELKSAKVTEGYNLNVTYYVKGKNLQAPKELDNIIIDVYKVNKTWVTPDGMPFDYGYYDDY